MASPDSPRFSGTVVACVTVFLVGRTAPLRRYQQTELSASITPTDCESGGLATLIPWRIAKRDGVVSSGTPSRDASIQKALSCPSRRESETVKTPRSETA